MSHFGLRLVSDTIANILALAGYVVMNPGKNFNDMYKQNCHSNIRTSISDKNLKAQWFGAITKRMANAGIVRPEEKAEEYMNSVCDTDYDMLFISQDYNKYYQQRYNPMRDCALVPSIVFDRLYQNYTYPIYFNGELIGQSHVNRANPLIMTTSMSGNKRVYTDVYMNYFLFKLRKQFKLDLGGYYFFYPGPLDIKPMDFSTVQLSGLVGDYKDLNYEDICGRKYKGIGNWTSHCYYKSVAEGMTRLGEDLNVFKSNVELILRGLGIMGHANLRSNALGTQVVPPNHPGDRVDDSIPGSLDMLSYLHLLQQLSVVYQDIHFELHITRINVNARGEYTSTDYTDYHFNSMAQRTIPILVVIDRNHKYFQSGGHAVYLQLINNTIDNDSFGLISQEDLSKLLKNFQLAVRFGPFHTDGFINLLDPKTNRMKEYYIPSISFFQTGPGRSLKL